MRRRLLPHPPSALSHLSPVQTLSLPVDRSSQPIFLAVTLRPSLPFTPFFILLAPLTSSSVLPKPRAVTQLSAFPPPCCHGGKASWCFGLLPQQHSKVKSPPQKNARFPAAVPITTHSGLTLEWRQRSGLIIHFRCEKGKQRASTEIHCTCTMANVLNASSRQCVFVQTKITVSGVNRLKWSVLPFRIGPECRNKGGGVRARRRSRRSQGHLAVTKSLNLWYFFALNSALQAAPNPELPLSELHPSNDYVQGLQILARKPRFVSRRGDVSRCNSWQGKSLMKASGINLEIFSAGLSFSITHAYMLNNH